MKLRVVKDRVVKLQQEKQSQIFQFREIQHLSWVLAISTTGLSIVNSNFVIIILNKFNIFLLERYLNSLYITIIYIIFADLNFNLSKSWTEIICHAIVIILSLEYSLNIWAIPFGSKI